MLMVILASFRAAHFAVLLVTGATLVQLPVRYNPHISRRYVSFSNFLLIPLSLLGVVVRCGSGAVVG
jgi:hypothetical protein